MSAATRVIASCAGNTLAMLLVLLSAFTNARIVQAAATAVVAMVFVALCLAAADSRRADRAKLAEAIGQRITDEINHDPAEVTRLRNARREARYAQRAAGNAPVDDKEDDDTPGR